jgi:hypothetical protein
MNDITNPLAVLGPSPELVAAVRKETRSQQGRKRRQHTTPPNYAKQLKSRKERQDTHPRVKPSGDLFQVRTLPDRLGVGLYCENGEDSYWYGDHGYRALTGYSAKTFDTTEEARQFLAKLNPPKEKKNEEG